MSFPAFYDPRRVGQRFPPDIQAAVEAGAALNLPAATLHEALCYHSAARQSQPLMLSKGFIPQTERYSIFEPEVKVAEHPQGGFNHALLRELESYDLAYLAGQAKSHCVLETVNSVMRALAPRPEGIRRLRILEDGMSSVAVPGIDFDALANEEYQRLRKKGLTFSRTTEAIG